MVNQVTVGRGRETEERRKGGKRKEELRKLDRNSGRFQVEVRETKDDPADLGVSAPLCETGLERALAPRQAGTKKAPGEGRLKG